MNFVVEKIVDRILETGLNRLDKEFEEATLKRIFRKSMEDYICFEEIRPQTNNGQCVIIDEKKINALDSRFIQPNLPVETLVSNLEKFFEECILVDDEQKRNSISKYICCNYKSAVVDFITLGHVDEDLHEIYNAVIEGQKEIVNEMDRANTNIDKMSEDVKNINNKMHSREQYPLCFIDELKDCKVFYYISMQVVFADNDDYTEIVRKLGEDMCAEMALYSDKDGIVNIDYNFFEPTTQAEMREFLRKINDIFKENQIRIISLSSHA